MNGVVCIDASVAVKWVLPEEDSERAEALFHRITADRDTMIAPGHMPVEVLNAIWKKAGRGDITQAEADESLEAFLQLPISLAAPAGLHEAALRLSRRFNRPTVYDTEYVALAEIAGCELWTADIRLVNALDGGLPFVKPLRAFED